MRLIEVNFKDLTKEFISSNKLYIQDENENMVKVSPSTKISVEFENLPKLKVFKLEKGLEEEWLSYQDIEWVDGKEYICKLPGLFGGEQKTLKVRVKINELLVINEGKFLSDSFTLKTITDAKYKKVE